MITIIKNHKCERFNCSRRVKPLMVETKINPKDNSLMVSIPEQMGYPLKIMFYVHSKNNSAKMREETLIFYVRTMDFTLLYCERCRALAKLKQ